MPPDFARRRGAAGQDRDPPRGNLLLLDQPVELHPEPLQRVRAGIGGVDPVAEPGLAGRHDLLAAAVETAGERGDGLRVAVVLEQLVALEAEPRHDVGPDERLARVVEDPEDVVGVDEQAPEELEPAKLEVLALVDDDRVIARVRSRDDRRLERARERLVPPALRDWVRSNRQDARLGAEPFAQAVEGRHVESGRGRRFLQLVDQARGEALVEADQERPIALASQPSCLLRGEHRLPAPGGADDLEPAQRARPADDERLLAGGCEEVSPVVLDVPAHEAMERPRRREELVDQAHPERSEQRTPRPVAEPVSVRAFHPAADRLGRLERLGVEDELPRGVRAEQDVAARQAREVDVRQGDRVAGTRLGPRRPVCHLGELADQLVLAVLRLRERVAVHRAVADPPAPGVVARRDTRLHLEDEDPVPRVHDDEVRLAVPWWPSLAHRAEPPGVRVEVEGVGRQGGTDSLGDEAFGGFPAWFYGCHRALRSRMKAAASAAAPPRRTRST